MIHKVTKKKAKYYMKCGKEKIQIEDPYDIKECPYCGESLYKISNTESKFNKNKPKRRKQKKSTS